MMPTYKRSRCMKKTFTTIRVSTVVRNGINWLETLRFQNVNHFKIQTVK